RKCDAAPEQCAAIDQPAAGYGLKLLKVGLFGDAHVCLPDRRASCAPRWSDFQKAKQLCACRPPDVQWNDAFDVSEGTRAIEPVVQRLIDPAQHPERRCRWRRTPATLAARGVPVGTDPRSG